jgi:hypothetical protein
MANVKGKKFGLTSLFPIRPGGHTSELRDYLRRMASEPYGSPLSGVKNIHMARFAIINDLVFEGVPAKRDLLKSNYLLFMCDFDGATVDALVAVMLGSICQTVHEIWCHCVGYPGHAHRDHLTAYFEQCQLDTTLFLTDRPDDDVEAILRALMWKREFANFVERCQNSGNPATKAGFLALMEELARQPIPMPGSM